MSMKLISNRVFIFSFLFSPLLPSTCHAQHVLIPKASFLPTSLSPAQFLKPAAAAALLFPYWGPGESLSEADCPAPSSIPGVQDDEDDGALDMLRGGTPASLQPESALELELALAAPPQRGFRRSLAHLPRCPGALPFRVSLPRCRPDEAPVAAVAPPAPFRTAASNVRASLAEAGRAGRVQACVWERRQQPVEKAGMVPFPPRLEAAMRCSG